MFTAGIIPFMTFRARGLEYRLCVAVTAGRTAMMNPIPAFLANPRVWTIVGREPVQRSVAGLTIRAKRTGMKNGIGMTTVA